MAAYLILHHASQNRRAISQDSHESKPQNSPNDYANSRRNSEHHQTLQPVPPPKGRGPAWRPEETFIWNRTIPCPGDANERWYQCIISSDGIIRPTLSITCQMQPRNYHTQRQQDTIRDYCYSAVRYLEQHRLSRGCDCDFMYLRTGRTSETTAILCPPSRRRVLKVFSSRFVALEFMKRHDLACSCDCFDTESLQGHLGSTETHDLIAPTHDDSQRAQVFDDLNGTQNQRDFCGEWYSEGPTFATRTIWPREDPNGLDWYQCRISGPPRPDLTITCKMQARETPYLHRKRGTIRLRFHAAASFLDLHREHRKCDCDFEYLMTGKTSQVTTNLCPPSRRKVFKIFSDRHLAIMSMKMHDKICSCGCFDLAVGVQQRA